MRKSIFSFLLDMFAKLTAAIFLFSSIYIYIFNGLKEFLSVTFIWGILAEAFLLTLAYIPFIIEKEMTKKRFVICNMFYFVFADFVVLAFAFLFKWCSLNQPATIIAMEITFIVVFTAVYAAIFISIKKDAVKMNEQLKKIKQN